MPPRRFGPARPDVTLEVDGDDVQAVRGEPIAVALLAAGRLVLGRSVKYHRPRGAVCYAGRCDGCLMRVDGVPSRVTCRVPCEHGLQIETQNVLGSASVDLLAATDWFFPGGMDHHRMFTWSRAANRAMQTVARRIAGVGRLPDEPSVPLPVVDVACDVLVVGAGASGLAAATEAARSGARVLVIDEESQPGGRLARAVANVRNENGAALDPRALGSTLAEAARARGVEIALARSVVGVYAEAAPGDEMIAIADGDDGLWRVRARRIVIAQGRHEGGAAFEGNDLPGIVGSDAALRLLAHGVLVGERIVLAGEGLEPLAEAMTRAGAAIVESVPLPAVARARGRGSVKHVDLRDPARSVACDALVIAPPTSAVYELAEQAGAEVGFDGEGFVVAASPSDGATRHASVRCVGSASGVLEAGRSIAQARAAGAAIAAELEASRG